jgi:hypothetical protein
MKASELAQLYFDLSNARDLKTVETLLQLSITYSSDNTGLYFGRENVMKMMREFFDLFPQLHWEVHSLISVSEHIAEIIFTLTGTKNDGTKITRPGIERIVVEQDLIRHIEVRNRKCDVD